MWSLCISWCDKFFDFDRKVGFWFVLESKSVYFTDVLGDFLIVNRCAFINYSFTKYGVFGWVRLKPYFIRVWWDFWWDSGDFWWCEKWWNAWFFNVLSKSLSKWLFWWVWGEISRKRWFYKEFVSWTDVLFWQSNTCSKNVNPPGIHTEQTFSNIQ